MEFGQLLQDSVNVTDNFDVVAVLEFCLEAFLGEELLVHLDFSGFFVALDVLEEVSAVGGLDHVEEAVGGGVADVVAVFIVGMRFSKDLNQLIITLIRGLSQTHPKLKIANLILLIPHTFLNIRFILDILDLVVIAKVRLIQAIKINLLLIDR